MSPRRREPLFLMLWMLVVLNGVGCSVPPILASAPKGVESRATPSPWASLTVAATASPTPAPSATMAPTTEPTLVAPTLRPTSSTPLLAPTIFTTTLLMSFVRPEPYVDDICEYLRARWDPFGSAPGTVVVPIMFHGVSEGKTYQPGSTLVPDDDLRRTVETAVELGFQTITASQLADFLEHNAYIPPRSMIWIVDDRRPSQLRDHFIPIARANGWTITLGWPVDDDVANAQRWDAYLRDWHAEGLVDVQAHGMKHLYITTSTLEVDIRAELWGPLTSLEKQSGQVPAAHVWAGGNYTPRAVELAREAGYRIGFTINSRGPLMYDWIPLAQREIEVGDPLMLLPRYPASPSLPDLLRRAAAIGDAAATSAQESLQQEALFYESVCGCELPSRKGHF